MAKKLPINDVQIYKVMDVSTGHITENDNELLRFRPKGNSSIVYEYEEGYFVYCFNDPNAPDVYQSQVTQLRALGCSEDLLRMVDIAAQNGCKFVNFDRDGPVYGVFTQHEW